MKKLGFIGGGNMAEALARGLLANKVFGAGDLIVADVDPARRRKLARTLKVETTADNREVRANARALLLAVKPQNIDEVLAELATGGPAQVPSAKVKGRARRAPVAIASATKDRLFISIAAGITLERLTSGLGANRVIRVMPNAPAM